MLPLALLFSISVLYWQGKSANLLSIGAVDFGIIVDSATIIVENIYRHITAHDADRSRPLIDRIIDASAEIERALFFSTTIIVCAFIPLFSMTGPEGTLFGPMANTYAFAICGALFLAVTLAPVLCSFLFRNKSEATDTFLDKLMKLRYLKMLAVVLHHRGLTLVVMGSLFAWTLTLLPRLGGEFMPPLEEGYLWIRAILPRTASLDEAARIAPRLRSAIASVPEVRGVISHLGRPDDGTDVTGFFNIETGAPLRPMERWRTRPVTFLGRSLWRRPITRGDIEVELTAALGLLPAALNDSIGSQAQKPLAIVVVGAMACTLFLTRYMMPVLYSVFPAPLGHAGAESGAVVERSNYSARFMHEFPEEEGARPYSRHVDPRAAADGCDARAAEEGPTLRDGP